MPLPADISATAVTDGSRTLSFNLSDSMGAVDKIAAVDLVLKQTSELSGSSYRVHLHEISGDETDMDLKLLDSGEYTGKWHTLHVQNLVDNVDSATGKRNYRLLLSVSGEGEASLLGMLKPMLLIYTIENQTGEDSVLSPVDTGMPVRTRSRGSSSRSRSKESRQQHERDSGRGNRRRRDVSGAQATESTVSLQELKTLSCRKHTRTMTFAELGWPGSAFQVMSPKTAKFTFCYGTCNRPHQANTVSYTNHAKLVSLTRPELANEGIAPCCVPMEYRPIPITRVSKTSHVIIMTTYPDATSCRCL